MRMLHATKVKFIVTLLAFSLVCGPALFAASPTKQLEKGIALYEENRDEEAMDYLIDVLVNGSRVEVEEANKYINLIHSRMGGIQDPVEVDVNFKEGEAQRLQPGQDPAVLEAQMAAEADPIVEEVAQAQLPATAQDDLNALNKLQEEQAQAAAQAAEQAKLAAAQKQAEAEALQAKAAEELAAQQALAEAKAAEELAALEAKAQEELAAQEALAKEKAAAELAAVEATMTDVETQVAEKSSSSSTFTDLNSPSALQARQVYTSQKLENMKAAVVARLEKAKGVRLYFRNNLPDAIDIDSEVLFNGYKFRPESLSVLDDIYTLMALTQGAGYVILPPGSYTDNITLSGIRQAMALNSFLVHKGLSSGKLSYNMGLYDQEPPAQFANLDGVSIVFDYEEELPASLPDAASVNNFPMLSMAVVPVSNKIDPAAGEAFAIDFSVIETANAIDNWVFQVVQHAADGGYYVVRQLEGFSPVYHQIVWNGRKGIIGPELACGTYTLALTAADVQGGKRTIRRQVEVACSAQKAQESKKAAAGKATDDNLNYKTLRLWTRPGRTMKQAVVAEEPTAETEVVDPFADAAPAAAVADPLAATADPYAAQPTAGVTDPYAQPLAPASGQNATDAAAPTQGVNSPYDMPYEQY